MKWTSAEDQRLLLVVLDIHKIDHAKVAARWAEKYDGPAPTAKAISEHVAKVKRDTNGGKVPPSTPAPSTPAASRKPAASKSASKRSSTVKTPTTSGKRKRLSMSEEDDSEDERKLISESANMLRSSLSRRSKSVGKTYNGESEEADDEKDDLLKADAAELGLSLDQGATLDATDETSIPFRLPSSVANGALQSAMDRANSFAAATNGGTGKKMRKTFAESGDDSDVSNFEPAFGL